MGARAGFRQTNGALVVSNASGRHNGKDGAVS
jgi:hypothetical protein